MADVNWDSSEQPSTFKPPEPGIYTFNIVNAVEGVSSVNGTPYIKIICENVTVPGMNLTQSLYLSEKAMRFTRKVLASLGVPKGMKNVKPHYLVGAVFEGVCKVKLTEKKDKTYTDLELNVFYDEDGFSGGVRLAMPSVNMPDTANPPEPDNTPF